MAPWSLTCCTQAFLRSYNHLLNIVPVSWFLSFEGKCCYFQQQEKLIEHHFPYQEQAGTRDLQVFLSALSTRAAAASVVRMCSVDGKCEKWGNVLAGPHSPICSLGLGGFLLEGEWRNKQMQANPHSAKSTLYFREIPSGEADRKGQWCCSQLKLKKAGAF